MMILSDWARRIRFLFLPILAVLIATPATAYMTLDWVGEGPTPDGMPVARLDLSPKAAAAYRPKFSTYAVIQRDISADGTTTRFEIRAGTPELLKLIEDSHPEQPMKPATRKGHPVDSRFRITLIWDMAGSSSVAAPRLLQITRPWSSAAAGDPFHHGGEGVPIVVHLDRLGNPMRVTSNSAISNVTEAISHVVLQWTFTPALRHDEAVESDLPLIVVPESDARMPDVVVTPPRLLKKVWPLYPNVLAYSNIRGVVTVGFSVDVLGHVTNATVTSSSNPGFEEEALAAVRQWIFRPAEQEGRPVEKTMQVPIVFIPQKGGRDQFNVSGGDPSKLGYDVAPRIVSVALANYPYPMIKAEKTGTAAVNLGIDADGRVAAIGGVAGSTPEFARALVAAAQQFRFQPARLKGKVVPCVLHYTENFAWDSGTAWSPEIAARDDRDLSRSLDRHPEWMVGSGKLDEPPKAISQRAAEYPVNWKASHPEGTAVIELVVDPSGRARLPRVLSSSQEEFGYSAVQAAQYWRFDPPKSHGKSVYTHVVIPFRFQLRPEPAR